MSGWPSTPEIFLYPGEIVPLVRMPIIDCPYTFGHRMTATSRRYRPQSGRWGRWTMGEQLRSEGEV